jgi:hypothetical protein
LPRCPPPQPDEGLLQRSEDAARLLIAVGGYDIGGGDDIGRIELARRLEAFAIDGDRL